MTNFLRLLVFTMTMGVVLIGCENEDGQVTDWGDNDPNSSNDPPDDNDDTHLNNDSDTNSTSDYNPLSPKDDNTVIIPMECDCNGVGTTLEDMLCALDICDESVVISNDISSPMEFTGTCDLADTYEAVSHFGDSGNGLTPLKNNSYALLATGPANPDDKRHSWDCTRSDLPGSGIDDPFVSDGEKIFDVVEWKLELKAPDDAQAFRFKYVFFSIEYDDYISSNRNDKFYAILNAPKTTSGEDKIINYTDCRDPFAYYDFGGEECDTNSGFCCYVAINSALSDCCWYPYKSNWVDNSPSLAACAGTSSVTTDIGGTGFECADGVETDGDTNGSSTGWLQTTWPIAGGETFTITFHLHDTADGYWDSEVILDAFEFVGGEQETQTGTVEIIIE